MPLSAPSDRGQSRQLAAILFADIMGFTGIMDKDEKLAMHLRDKLICKGCYYCTTSDADRSKGSSPDRNPSG